MRWTPDGSALLVSSATADRGARLLRVPRDGGPVETELDYTALTSTIAVPPIRPGESGTIDISRDGSLIAFDAARFPTQELWAIDNILDLLNRQ